MLITFLYNTAVMVKHKLYAAYYGPNNQKQLKKFDCLMIEQQECRERGRGRGRE